MTHDGCLAWKPDWPDARQALTAWCEHRGLALSITAPRHTPWARLPEPPPRHDPQVWWHDLCRRIKAAGKSVQAS